MFCGRRETDIGKTPVLWKILAGGGEPVGLVVWMDKCGDDGQ